MAWRAEYRSDTSTYNQSFERNLRELCRQAKVNLRIANSQAKIEEKKNEEAILDESVHKFKEQLRKNQQKLNWLWTYDVLLVACFVAITYLKATMSLWYAPIAVIMAIMSCWTTIKMTQVSLVIEAIHAKEKKALNNLATKKSEITALEDKLAILKKKL